MSDDDRYLWEIQMATNDGWQLVETVDSEDWARVMVSKYRNWTHVPHRMVRLPR